MHKYRISPASEVAKAESGPCNDSIQHAHQWNNYASSQYPWYHRVRYCAVRRSEVQNFDVDQNNPWLLPHSLVSVVRACHVIVGICVRRGLLLSTITVDVWFSWQLHFVVICLNMKMIIFLKKTKCELKKQRVPSSSVYIITTESMVTKRFGHLLEIVFWMLWRCTFCTS